MVGISFLGILLILTVFGGGAAVLGLTVFALLKGRPGLAALVVGSAFLLLIGVGVFAAIFVAYISHRSVVASAPTWAGGPVMDAAQVTINGMQQSPPFSGGTHTTWSFALTPVLFLVCGGVALIAIVARRGLAHSAACGRGRIWPALLVLPLLAFFLIVNVRYQKTTSSHAEQAARENEIIQQQQVAIAKQVAAMSKDVQNQIAKMDIHELMDKFDAPRIVLQAPSAPTAAPAALVIAAAEATSDTKKTNSKNATAAKGSKERTQSKFKRPEKSSSDSPGVTKVAEITATEGAASTLEVAAKSEKATAARPAWIDNPPKRVGNVQQEVIATDDWSTEEECDRARNVGLMLKTYEHIQRLVGDSYQGYLLDHRMSSENAGSDSRLARLASVGITVDYVLHKIAKDEYVETVERSVGPMKKMYTLVEFSPAVDGELRERWDSFERRERFAYVGVGAASVLGLLSMVWGLLKVDTATKGYYTKRLFLGVPIAIIGVMLMLLAAFHG